MVITMINADGTRYPMTGQVLECDPPTRIVMSVDTNAHPAAWRELVNRARGLSADAPSFPLTWIVTLEDVPEGTRMHIVNRLANERDRDAIFGLGASDGWSQSLDKLERVLANGA